MGARKRNGPKKGMATVSGRVLDAAGVPVPHGGVNAIAELVRKHAGYVTLGMTVADDEGRFTLEDLPPGPCVVVASLQLWVGGELTWREVEAGIRLTLEPGASLEGIDVRLPFALADLAWVVGTLRDEAGMPFEHLQVQVAMPAARGQSWRCATTDREGRFEIRGLLPGERDLRVFGTRSFEPLAATLLLAPGAKVGSHLTLRRREAVGALSTEIRCEDELGRGLPGVPVEIEGDPTFHEEVVTGSEGEIRVDGLPPDLAGGWFCVGAHVPGRQWVRESRQYPFQPWPDRVVLRLEREELAPASRRPRRSGNQRLLTSEVSGRGEPEEDAPLVGRVLDGAGVPLAGAAVYWSAEPGAGEQLQPQEVARTDREGRFEVRGLPQGPAILLAEYRGAILSVAFAEAAEGKNITLVSGSPTFAEITLPFVAADLATVKCTVRDPSGRGRWRASVSIEGLSGQRAGGGSRDTDFEGRVTFDCLGPGDWRLLCWEDADHREVEKTLSLRAGETACVVLETPPRKGDGSLSLEVEVVDDEGRPVPDAKVHISTTGGGLGERRSGADGRVTISGLPDDLRGRDLQVSAYAGEHAIGSPSVAVNAWSAAGTASARVVLWRTREIQARVRDARTGVPIPWCHVEVQSGLSTQGSSSPGGEVLLACEPRFSVVAGEAILRARAPGYRPAEIRIEVKGRAGLQTFDLRLERETG